MEYYKSLEEKEEFFISTKPVDCLEDLDLSIKLIEKINANNEWVFRGQPEAKFKLYNTLQRLWIEKNLDKCCNKYSDLIKSLIDNCKKWNNHLIYDYLNTMKEAENDLGYLCIMQHFGVPTPLLDVTLDIYKSLFFAIENVGHSCTNSKIKQYFSVYYFLKQGSVFFLNEMIRLNKFPTYNKENPTFTSGLESLMKSKLVFIDNHFKDYNIQNNLNVISQNGAFIFNSSPNEPLENCYQQMQSRIIETAKPYYGTLDLPNKVCGCLNINKKLVGKITTYLKERGINKDSIYPDLYKLRNYCLDVSMK